MMTTQKEIQNITMMKVHVNNYLGFSTSSNDDKSIIKPVAKWENDFKLWVIGTSYCHSRQFKVDENTLEFFKMYVLVPTM